MFEDWFSGVDAGGYEVAQAYGGPQEDVVFQQFSQTGTLPAWEEANAQVNAALSSASADYDARLAADLQFIDAQSVNASLSSAGSDYAARLAADLAKIGVSVAGSALKSPTGKTVTSSPLYRNGAAILTGARPVATFSTTFDWKEALVGVAVLAGIVVVVKAL